MQQNEENPAPGRPYVCPARFGWLLSTSLRRLAHKPERILAGLIEPGQTAADIGCGPGFFTLPMAELVGPEGCVIAIDLQQGMLDQVRRRAERAGLLERIRLHRAGQSDLGLKACVDFALAFYMVHEVPDARAFLRQVREMLKPGGRFLVVEPIFHVPAAKYRAMLETAREMGFQVVAEPRIAFSRSAVLAHARPAAGGEMGVFTVADVYQGVEPAVKRGTAKYIRVCEEVHSGLEQRPDGSFRADYDPFQDFYASPTHKVTGPYGWPSYVAKASLGLAPVEADGSASFLAPAGKVLYFELRDEKYNELQRMRSVVQLQPGESRGCIGCHESRNSAPPTRLSLAMRRPPSRLELPPWGAVPYSYEKVVQPVLDARCVSCHNG